MTSMAGNPSPDGCTRVEGISEQHPVPDAFLLQIFQMLTRSGLFRLSVGVMQWLTTPGCKELLKDNRRQ